MSARRLMRKRWLTRWISHPSWWIDAVIAAALGAAVVLMVWVVFG